VSERSQTEGNSPSVQKHVKFDLSRKIVKKSTFYRRDTKAIRSQVSSFADDTLPPVKARTQDIQILESEGNSVSEEDERSLS
jgi:hypothetical protein